ncbi:unnamed protein product [Timema podura]|uniref:Uncharacterized protein n=1 Tax=Timema podura TaxID=61482 RepID=A0ABN7P700_TIMPD|nr:unnamed protein product [Timema podura]
MCWVVQSTSSKVNQGTAGSVDKIVDGLTSIPWLESLVVGTPVQEAIKNGRQDKNCSHLYSKCPISQEKLILAAKNFMAGLP